MTPTLTTRIAIKDKYGSNQRSELVRHQLRIAETCDSPAVRKILAGNVERLRQGAA